MNRKLKWNPNERRKRHYKVTRCKHRDFREFTLENPQLRWVDSLLRSFQDETPPDWMPAQYREILSHHWLAKRLA